MRTGQAHRTLLGHTGPVTCLQFDEIHIASGSLDKTLKVRYFNDYQLHTHPSRFGTSGLVVYLTPLTTTTPSLACSLILGKL